MVSVFNENLNRLKKEEERFQHSDAGRKMKKLKLCVENHPVALTLLGIIIFVALSPFFLIAVIVMVPLFVFLSFFHC